MSSLYAENEIRSATVKKVKNGFILTINYDQYVFKTYNQLSKFLEKALEGTDDN